MEKPPFDELMHLARHNPEAFEALRLELVENLIASTPPARQRRLRGLQFVIDTRRGMAANPTQALIEIQKMMHNSLACLRQALNPKHRPAPGSPSQPAAAANPDNVIRLFQHQVAKP